MRTHRLALGAAALLASCLVATSGGASIDRRIPVGERHLAQGRRCTKASIPARLPEVDALVDVDALRNALAPVLAEASAAGDTLFSIRFKSDGQREWVQRIRDQADTGVQPGIGRLIGEHLKNQQRSPEPWSVRLHVIPGDPVRLSVAHSQVCPVEPLPHRPASSGGSLGLMTREDVAELQRAGPVVVRVDVSATGRVLGVELVRRSGSRAVDDRALYTARESTYRPALVDGFPVADRFEFGTRTRVRVRSGPVRN